VLLARLGIGASVGATSTLQFSVLSGGAVPAERGQLLGLATALTHVGNLAGFVLGGLLATWWAEVGNFALAAAAYAVVTVVSLRLELRANRVAEPGLQAAGA
jgi:MFS family permease